MGELGWRYLVRVQAVVYIMALWFQRCRQPTITRHKNIIYHSLILDRISMNAFWATHTFSNLIGMRLNPNHYSDVIMSSMVSQITGVSIVYSTVCSGAGQRKLDISVSLAFVREIHRWLVDSPHKGPVPQKMFPFDDVIMNSILWVVCCALTLLSYCKILILFAFFCRYRWKSNFISKYAVIWVYWRMK